MLAFDRLLLYNKFELGFFAEEPGVNKDGKK